MSTERIKWPVGLHPLDQAHHWFPYSLYKWQRDVLNAAAIPYSRCICTTNNECLPVDTLIYTGSGYIDIGSLKVGDNILDGDGDTQKVTKVFHPKDQRECYLLEFSDNTNIECTPEHLWRVKTDMDGMKSWTVMTTERIAGLLYDYNIIIPTVDGKKRMITHCKYSNKNKVCCISVTGKTSTYIATEDKIITHNSGKTSAIGPIFVLSTMMAFPGARCIATSGSDLQIKTQFFETNILPLVEPLVKYGWKVWTGDTGRVLAPNGSDLKCFVCKDAGKFEGFHSGNNKHTGVFEPCLVFADESKSIKDEIHDAIRRINPTFFLGMSSPGDSGWFQSGINQERLKVIVAERGGEDTPERLAYKELADRILE